MYQLIPLNRLIHMVLWLGAITFVVSFIMPRNPDNVWGLLENVSFTIALVGFLLFMIGKVIWHPIGKIPWVQKWFFPHINGIWFGYICTNWPILESKQAAFDRGFKQSNGEESEKRGKDKPEQAIQLTPIKIALRVKADLFRISVAMEGENNYTSSDTVTVMPTRAYGSENPKLYWVFKATTPEPKPTDSPCHDGAAWLDIHTQSDSMEMSGLYWTNRRWEKGLNTAGKIRLFHISRDPAFDWRKVLKGKDPDPEKLCDDSEIASGIKAVLAGR